MQPLYEAIDPDALDALFRPPSDGTPRVDGSVTFVLDGLYVTVHATGKIQIEQPEIGDEE